MPSLPTDKVSKMQAELEDGKEYGNSNGATSCRQIIAADTSALDRQRSDGWSEDRLELSVDG